MSTLFGQPDVEAKLRDKIIELQKEIRDLRKGNEDREKDLKESLKYMATSVQGKMNLIRNGMFDVSDILLLEEVVIDGQLEKYAIDLTSIHGCRESWKRWAEAAQAGSTASE